MNPVLCIHVPDSSLYIIYVFYSSRIRTLVAMVTLSFHRLIMGKVERGGLTVYEIYIGFCPRTDFFDIMHIACLVNDHFISNIDFLLTT